MKRRLNYSLIVGGLLALLLAAAACSPDIKPVEDRVGSVEQIVSALQGKVSSVEGRVSTLEGKMSSVKESVGKIGAPAGLQHFYLTAFEVKGATDGIAPPSVNPKDLSDGYGFKPPGEYDSSNPNKWQVASYMWTPGAMTVLQGDTVDLTIFVLNGDKHEVWVEAPNGDEVIVEFEMNRGREYSKSFTASQAGVYTLICNTHEPTMTAIIQVLPRS